MQKPLYTQQYRVLLAQRRKAWRLDVIELKRWVKALGLGLPEFLQALK